jgi:DNA-directed RNA polymerase subunit RPC12/RpoP
MRLREKLARFLYGRYGADSLYNALFVCELILLFIGTILNVLGNVEPILAMISIAFYVTALGLMIFAMYRFFSRNIAKRRRENQAWLRFKAKFRRKPKRRLPPDTADHIFRSCPHCKSTLRLPREKGKHQVKCPRCGERFGVKVK